jgi:hypothetical protein
MTTTAGDMLSMPLRKLILNAPCPGPWQEASRALTELMQTVLDGAR